MRSGLHVLSFGGGVNSVALMIWLVENRQPLNEAVFADTGGEVPETYEYLEVAQQYLSQRGIPLRRVGRPASTNLYTTCWKRRVIPSAIWRWSTRDFKVGPIHRYYRSLKMPILQYIAIAYDEIERMKDSRAEYVTNLYPLVEQRISREGCREIIARAGLPEPVKSGCFFCPFNSHDRWKWLYGKHPDLFEDAVKLEENSQHFPLQRLTDQVFRKRDRVTLRELGARLDSGIEAETIEEEVSACGGECMT